MAAAELEDAPLRPLPPEMESSSAARAAAAEGEREVRGPSPIVTPGPGEPPVPPRPQLLQVGGLLGPTPVRVGWVSGSTDES